MSDMTEAIEVDVDADTAFSAFTEDFDDWWGDGHIDSWYGYKVVDHRMEPGVGGRVLEVHEDGELELARITVWEPPHRVAWQSSVDDVAIDVRFDPLGADRTKVSVRAEIPTGGTDRGGTSFFRMIPQWLPPHLARKAAGTTRPSLGRLHVLVRASKPVALVRWLADVIPGLDHEGLPAEDGPDAFPWLELRAGGSSIVVWKAEDGHELSPTANHEVWVYVDDLDAAFERARANGATIIDPIHEHGYRRFVLQDPEGNRWSLLQARPALRSTRAAPAPAAAR